MRPETQVGHDSRSLNWAAGAARVRDGARGVATADGCPGRGSATPPEPKDTDHTRSLSYVTWRRVEPGWTSASVLGILDPRPIRQDPQRCYRQDEPIAGDAVRVSAARALPLPAHAFQGPNAEFDPHP